jgi:hypothetical protein
VNRHEHDDRRGKYVDRAGMVRDIVLMKQLNFNAVHTPRPPLLTPPPTEREREREGEKGREKEGKRREERAGKKDRGKGGQEGPLRRMEAASK